MTGRTLAERLAAAARELQDEMNTGHTLDRLVELAKDLVSSGEHAGISMVHRRQRIDTPAASSEVARRVDELQYLHREGPCLDALHKSEVVYSSDIANDARWPTWGPTTANEVGIRSMMCFRLFTNESTLGAMNMYASRPDAFDDTDREHGLALAAHAAVAVAASREIDSLTTALDNRGTIGQAMGILMERFDMQALPAFQTLVRVSSTSNRKLIEVATELIETRKTPGV